MFRLATDDDLAWLNDLEQRCFARNAWSESLLAGAVAAEQIGLDVQRGYFAMRVNDEVAELDRIAVLPERRREGHGSALLDEASRRSQDAGAERLMLEVAASNSPALALYRSAGFAELDRRVGYYGHNVDAIVMSRAFS